jgi:predicted permease
MRLRNLLRRSRWDEERTREIESYLQIETEENIARGMSPPEAFSAARRKLGSPTRIREEIYLMNTFQPLDSLARDLRYAVLQIRRCPGFALAAVVSLALGIGANTAVFSLLDQVLLRLLPVKDPEKLVSLQWHGERKTSNMGDYDVTMSYPLYRDIRDNNQVFTGVLCRFPFDVSVACRGTTEIAYGELVSGNYFELLGIPAAVGRVFTADEDVPGGHPLAVLNYAFWKERYGSDRGAVGQSILVNNVLLTIVGVASQGFDGIELGVSPKVWIPVAMKKELTGFFGPNWSLENRRASWVQAYGRLTPGVTPEQARASLAPLFQSILEAESRDPQFASGPAESVAYIKERFLRSTLEVAPASQGRSGLRTDYKIPLQVLMALVGLVLLMACVNVANLLLARTAARKREIGVRLALGAGRARLVRQLLVESSLLALLGGAAGLLLAAWLDGFLLEFIPRGDSHLVLNTTPDLRVVGFTLAVGAATTLLFGLVPALGAARVDLIDALKERGHTAGSAPLLRRSLIAAQVFFSVLLLAAAGLFVRSLMNIRSQDPGFRTDHIIAFAVDPSLSGYRKERAVEFYRELSERIGRLPGVESAALGQIRVLQDEWNMDIEVEGYPQTLGEDMNQYFNDVTPGYFATLGIPVLAGREFLPSDARSGHGVVIINRALASHYFGGSNPIGRFLKMFGGTRLEIVGVVSDTKYLSMREPAPRQVFVDLDAHPDPAGSSVYVRTHSDLKSMSGLIRRAVGEIDPNVPVFTMRTLEEQVDRDLATDRLVASLALAFGAVAALLAAVGLYGLMAFNVTRRTQEIGVRLALGAPQRAVVWLVIKESLLLIAIGAMLAVPSAFVLSQYVRSQLFGITPADPVTIVAVLVVLGSVALAAGLLPARRASRLDPMAALTVE